jgi:hypothetical protein
LATGGPLAERGIILAPGGKPMQKRVGSSSSVAWLPWAFVLLLLPARPGMAAPARFQAGEYVTEGDEGQLVLKRAPGGGLSFAIGVVSGSGHSCSLAGEIVDARASLKATPEDSPCIVSFRLEREGIAVKAVGVSCHHFCGARADFQAVYLKPRRGCDSAARQKTRAQFQRLYDQQAYARAWTTLSPVLGRCTKITSWVEMGWIRNDLALTRYKLKDLAGCRRLLAPLAEYAAKSDDQVLREAPSADAETYPPLLRATRTHLKLCTAR